MKKRLLSLSVAAAILVFAGCKEEDETTVSGLESQFQQATAGPVDAAYAQKLTDGIIDSIEADQAANEIDDTADTSSLSPSLNAAKSPELRSGDGVHDCLNGGTVTIDSFSLTSPPPTLTLNGTFSDCTTGLIVQNGSVGFSFVKEDQTLTATQRFTTDFTRTGGLFDFVFFKESQWTLTATEGNNYFDALKDYVITVNGHKRGAEDWLHRHFTAPHQAGWYPISGKVYVDNLEKYYTVDPDYDASVTPFLLNSYGRVESGQSRYVGANNGKYKIAVESVGYFTISLDSDGDGEYDDGSVTIPHL